LEKGLAEVVYVKLEHAKEAIHKYDRNELDGKLGNKNINYMMNSNWDRVFLKKTKCRIFGGSQING
jgi:hypothetical protein